MEENKQTEDGVSLLDIFKLLLSKIKILLLVVLVGAILGATLGIWKTHNVDYYGTSVEFYVNPEKKVSSSDDTQQGGSQYGVYGAYGRHVMDNMVRLLSSEIFAEQLMLAETDENGLLTGSVKSLPAKQEGNDALNAKIDAAQTALDEDAKNAKALVDQAFDEWRKTSSYKGLLSRIVSATKYAYLEDSADAEEANNLARSFIYVKISVLNDKEFAEDLLDRIKEIVPVYIEANMAVPDGYQGTNCQPTTTVNQIVLTNPGYTRNQTIKYALLFAVVAGVVACVVVILLDRSDKRLRDYDVITKKFNIPVLGVVPAIDDLAPEASKKKTEKDTEVNA